MFFLLEVYLLSYLGTIIGEKVVLILRKLNKSCQFAFYLFIVFSLFFAVVGIVLYVYSFYNTMFFLIILYFSVVFGLVFKFPEIYNLKISQIFYLCIKK